MARARAILLACVFLAIGLAKCEQAAGQDAIPVAIPVTPDRDRPMGAGDTVSLQIVEDKTPAILKRVSDTGDLDVPYIGRVHVAGRSCADVSAQITRQLEDKYYYKGKGTVRLAIEQIAAVGPGRAGKVLVSGDVKTVGPQLISPGETLTVSGAVVRAGGATQFGNLKIVKLTHKTKDGKSQTYIIDVKAILEEGKTEKDMDLQDGDSIFVPRRMFTI